MAAAARRRGAEAGIAAAHGGGLVFLIAFRHCEEQSDEAIQLLFSRPWIASRSLSSGAHSRDPLARNDDPPNSQVRKSPDIAALQR